MSSITWRWPKTIKLLKEPSIAAGDSGDVQPKESVDDSRVRALGSLCQAPQPLLFGMNCCAEGDVGECSASVNAASFTERGSGDHPMLRMSRILLARASTPRHLWVPNKLLY